MTIWCSTQGMERRHVRVNVYHAGLLIGLSEDGAIVQIPGRLPVDRQTTLSIDAPDGETLHLRAGVVRCDDDTQASGKGGYHIVALQFLGLDRETRTTVRQMVDHIADRTLILRRHEFCAAAAAA